LLQFAHHANQNEREKWVGTSTCYTAHQTKIETKYIVFVSFLAVRSTVAQKAQTQTKKKMQIKKENANKKKENANKKRKRK